MTLEIEQEGQPSQELTPSGYFRPDGLVLPEVLSGQEYFEIGYRIRVAKKCSSLWMRQWVEYGERAYGEEFVEDTLDQIESQLQLQLGLPPEEPKPKLNEGLGKGTAIVNIEGISHSFSLWRRKAEIDRWGSSERKKAAELLRPMVEFYDLLLHEEKASANMMTFEIETRYTAQTYHARWKDGNVKATCTSGHQWAAKAIQTKLQAYLVESGEMKNPTFVSLEKIDEPKDYNKPVTWKLVLKEGR